MSAPTFVASYSTSFTSTGGSEGLSITTQAGDILVVVAAVENGADTLGSPSGNGLTYTLMQSVDISDQWCEAWVWTATDTTGGTNWTLNLTISPTGFRWGFSCFVFRNSDGIGASSKANVDGAAPSLNLTTTQADSAIVTLSADWQAADGGSRTWRTVNGITPTAGNNLEKVYSRVVGIYAAYVAYYNDVGSVGSKTVGLSAPSGQKYSIIAVEIKGTSPPPSLLLTNTAEGGTNGVNVSAANTGGASGDPFNTVNPGTGTIAFSNAQASHGTLSYSFVTVASANPNMIWNSSSFPISSKVMYSRCYIYFAAAPPFTGRFMQFMNTSIQLIGGVGINVSDKFTIRNSLDAVVATSTTTVPTNAWFRVEFYAFSSATIGEMEAQIFLDPHGTTPTEVVTTSSTENTRGDDIKAALFGLAGGTALADLYIDSIGVQNTGYLGPLPAPIATVAWITA